MPFSEPKKICPLCKQNTSLLFMQDYTGDGGNFSLFECQVCGGQFWHPFKNPGADWYINKDKYNIKEDLKPRQTHVYHKYFIKSHSDFSEDSRVLDLGCGTGEFLAELEKKGVEVYGTDIDSRAIEIARKNYGFKNIFDLPITVFFKTQKIPQFDYVTVFEVFEHVDDVWSILNQSKKFLKSGGKLVISAPTRERPFVNAAGWDYPYHHLSRWDEKSLRYHLELSGYKNVQIVYLKKFHQLYELFLEIIAAKLKFNKAAGLKALANKRSESVGKEEGFLKKFLIKIIYRVGRFMGVVLAPYSVAAMFYPILLIFYPHSGIMYVEATKE